MHISNKLRNYFYKLQVIDPLDINKFIFKYIIFQLFKTKNIIPFLITTSVIGFSIITEETTFIFLPQSNLTTFASFFIFLLAVSILVLALYPLFIIILLNFFISFIVTNSLSRYVIKITILFVCLIIGSIFFVGFHTVHYIIIIELFFAWTGLFIILVNVYIAYKEHRIINLSRLNIIFMVVIAFTMYRPLLLVFVRTSQEFNFTTVNNQFYLTPPNCALLQNLNGRNTLPPENDIFNNKEYFKQLPDNGGCYIYKNVIGYTFASDFTLKIRRNIYPIIGADGKKFNQYVRLSCYYGNCSSKTDIILKDSGDISNELFTIH